MRRLAAGVALLAALTLAGPAPARVAPKKKPAARTKVCRVKHHRRVCWWVAKKPKPKPKAPARPTRPVAPPAATPVTPLPIADPVPQAPAVSAPRPAPEAATVKPPVL